MEPTIPKNDQALFEEGYQYLLDEEYDQALDYYLSLEGKLESDYFQKKNASLVMILKRLTNSLNLYTEEKYLLESAEEFKTEFLDPLYESLSQVYDFYHLSIEVILEDTYDKEEMLVNTYLKEINFFDDLLMEIKKADSVFFTEQDKEKFRKTVYYSVLPTEMYYRTTHLNSSITMEEIETVETAWADWDKYYNQVMDYYQEFDEGYCQLVEDVDKIKQGYLDMKKQLAILVPDLKLDQYL